MTKYTINMYNHIMNERTKAIKALEKAGYFFSKGMAEIMTYKCSILLKRHDFNKNDLRYIQKEIEQGAKK